MMILIAVWKRPKQARARSESNDSNCDDDSSSKHPNRFRARPSVFKSDGDSSEWVAIEVVMTTAINVENTANIDRNNNAPQVKSIQQNWKHNRTILLYCTCDSCTVRVMYIVLYAPCAT